MLLLRLSSIFGFTISGQLTFLEKPTELTFISVALYITGSPSSKYEHRWASTLLSKIQNIRIGLGEKPVVSVTVFCLYKTFI